MLQLNVSLTDPIKMPAIQNKDSFHISSMLPWATTLVLVTIAFVGVKDRQEQMQLQFAEMRAESREMRNELKILNESVLRLSYELEKRPVKK